MFHTELTSHRVHWVAIIIFLVTLALTVGNCGAHHPPPPVPFVERGMLPEDLDDHHDCIHDDVSLQRDIAHHGMDHTAPQRLVKHLSARERSFHTLAVGPIRIGIDTSNMDDTAKYCETNSGTSTDMRGYGGTVACDSDNMLTAAKRSILLDKLLPRAIERIVERVSVDRVAGNLVMPAGLATCGNDHDVPAAHRSTGVADVDFVLYVSVAPSSGTTRAWAGYCSRDGNGRPIAGRANFNPKYLAWEQDGWSTESRKALGTAIHELLHAMGFTSSLMSLTDATHRGTSVKVLTGANVVAQGRKHFGCDTLAGVEVDDSSWSHWEQRNLYQEMMNPVSFHARRFSGLTLAMLDDLNVGYTVDYGKAEAMEFAHEAGCGFLENACDTAAGGLGTWFCSAGDPSYVCDFLRQGMGLCHQPSRMGTCRIYVSYNNFYCNETNGGNPAAPIYSHTHYGRTMGAGSRCFDSVHLGRGGTNHYLGTCVETQCPNGGAYAQYRMYGDAQWRDCPLDGSAGSTHTPSGWSGTIRCPAASEVCTPDNTLPATPAPTPIPPPPTTAQTTTAEPTTAEPTTAEPTTAEPTTAEPTTAEPTAARPTTAEPTTAEPTTAEPTTAEPTTAEPTTAEPTTAEPTTAEPTTAEPTTARPTTVRPTTAEPTTAEPTTARPTTAEPTTVRPTTAEPTTAFRGGLFCSNSTEGAVEGHVRILGSHFGGILADAGKKHRLAAALRLDLANLFQIAVSSVCIKQMALGSLVVDYVVAAGVNASSVNSTMHQTASNVTAGGNVTPSSHGGDGPSWLSAASQVYYEETNTTNTTETLSVDAGSLSVVAVSPETAAPIDDGEIVPEPEMNGESSTSSSPPSSNGNVIGVVVGVTLVFVVIVVLLLLSCPLGKASGESRYKSSEVA